MTTLLGTSMEPDELATVGYQLAERLRTMDPNDQAQFTTRITNASDAELGNVITAIDGALSSGRDDIAYLICTLLAPIPQVDQRLKALARQRRVPVAQLEALLHTIEHFVAELDDAFREEVYYIYLADANGDTDDHVG